MRVSQGPGWREAKAARRTGSSVLVRPSGREVAWGESCAACMKMLRAIAEHIMVTLCTTRVTPCQTFCVECQAERNELGKVLPRGRELAGCCTPTGHCAEGLQGLSSGSKVAAGPQWPRWTCASGARPGAHHASVTSCGGICPCLAHRHSTAGTIQLNKGGLLPKPASYTRHPPRSLKRRVRL